MSEIVLLDEFQKDKMLMSYGVSTYAVQDRQANPLDEQGLQQEIAQNHGRYDQLIRSGLSIWAAREIRDMRCAIINQL
jgi:hypothetical protein